MPDDRMTEIETRLTFAEHSVSELSDLVYKQSQDIERLAAQCRELEQRVMAPTAQGGQPPPEAEIPPHY